jgi:5-(aminomethyl)-3-furanmethanol phosphate kinase
MNATLVKIGGSLAFQPENLKLLCSKLSKAAERHKIVVVPGGGEFADVVREVDKRFNLSAETSHKMAILGMDQFGFLLSDLISNACVVNQLENLQKILNLNKLPIFLPSNLMLQDDPLENSWDVTSDSISVYVACQLNIGKVVLVTDVDGFYTCDPKKFSDAKLIGKISAKKLEKIHYRSCVDKFLPKLLLQSRIECIIVNGLFPARIEAVLDGENVISTLIS